MVVEETARAAAGRPKTQLMAACGWREGAARRREGLSAAAQGRVVRLLAAAASEWWQPVVRESERERRR
jgi:hypothetical protein